MDALAYRQIFCQAVKMIDGPDGFFVDGVMVAEEPDLTREIWDYATSKANIQLWSDSVASKTHGQSMGNLRAMHGDNTTAAGRFLIVQADDAQKLFHARAEVVDPIDQEKCRKGVYNGFSIKAPYAKKWRDGNYTRWTSGVPVEVSLVDVPCIPSACFSIKMADGTEEIRRFQSNSEEEITDMTVDELNKKFDDGFSKLTTAIEAIATKMAAAPAPVITDVVVAKEDATKAAGKVVAIDYINTAVTDAIKGLDIKKVLEDAVKAQFTPIEAAVEVLTDTVARMAGAPAPTAVKANGAGVVVDKKDDTEEGRVAVKSIAETAKKDPASAIKMIHSQGPSQVMTNRGLVSTGR